MWRLAVPQLTYPSFVNVLIANIYLYFITFWYLNYQIHLAYCVTVTLKFKSTSRQQIWTALNFLFSFNEIYCTIHEMYKSKILLGLLKKPIFQYEKSISFTVRAKDVFLVNGWKWMQSNGQLLHRLVDDMLFDWLLCSVRRCFISPASQIWIW